MALDSRRLSAIVFLTALGLAAAHSSAGAQAPGNAPTIPRVWDDSAIAAIEIPLPRERFSPVHVRADYYYRIPIRPIYKSYPIYAPGKTHTIDGKEYDNRAYLDWLKRQEPEVIFDASKLKTDADWIRAGEIVFDAPIDYESVTTVEDVNNLSWYDRLGVAVAKDGSMPFARYVVREKGKVEVGNNACAVCHTRVMADGAVLKGAQGNFPFLRAVAWDYRTRRTIEQVRLLERSQYSVPWRPDLEEGLGWKSVAEIASAMEAMPPGVLARHRSRADHPQRVPDLIGIKDQRYLDASGLVQHRENDGIVDLMRYSALNQGADDLGSFAGFIPSAEDFKTLPPAASQTRYSDEQLYALAGYLYALTPPENPNIPRAGNEPGGPLVAQGKAVFGRELCARCHTPPLYTNNRLMPVEGFVVPEEHRRRYRIMDEAIDTDPELTLNTRRGTGYYKVPSLRGVWYRSMFGHGGWCATLEDWFDPRRIEDDYVPTGFRGHQVKTRAVPGHEFGLDLDDGDRAALIAFLKTL